LGLGAFAGLERLKLLTFFAKYFDALVGGVAIILGAASLYDYISYKRTRESKDMILKLPAPIKNAIHRTVRIIKDKGEGRLGFFRLLLVAFAIGVVVSLLESMCTGQIYLPTITFILKMKVMWWRAFSLLVLYNAMFVLPLAAVLVATLFGVSSQQWAALVQRHLAKVKLATAFFFFGLAALILLLS